MDYVKVSDTVVEKTKVIPEKSVTERVDYKKLRFQIKDLQTRLAKLKAEAALCESAGIDPQSVDTTQPSPYVFGL